MGLSTDSRLVAYSTGIEAGRAIWGYNFLHASLPGSLSLREVVMPDRTWQALYRSALIEPDPIRLNSRMIGDPSPNSPTKSGFSATRIRKKP
jgi:hypothetical protein